MKAQSIKVSFPITGMHCAGCSANVERTLNRTHGVVQATVNLANAMASIEYNPAETSPQQIKEAVQAAGYDMLIEDAEEAEQKFEDIHQKGLKALKQKTIASVFLSIPIVLIGMVFMHIPYANYIMWALATPVVFVFGRQFFIGAWKKVRNKSLNMDTLVALSTGVAYLFSVFNTLFPEYWESKGLESHVYFEAAAVVISFILLGRLLEERAKASVSSSVKKLMGLQPQTVTRIKANTEHEEINIKQVAINDNILVKSGERIAVDGCLVSGRSFVDESMISGEPIAVEKNTGDKVFAGTINQKGSFVIRAEKVGYDTLLAQIIRKVQEAQASKVPIQRLADKIIRVFVPVVILIAVIAFVCWLILGGENGFTQGLLALVTVLVIACPCALGLATPTAIMVGISKGAEYGILIKDAESLELAKSMNAIVLDKTGTITEGKPEVTDIVWFNDNPELKNILASLERQSEHPLAEAILKSLNIQTFLQVEHFESLTGLGTKAKINVETYLAGNLALLQENNIPIESKITETANQWAAKAKTVTFFANTKEVLAIIAIADKIKQSSVETIQKLQSQGLEVYMLTGDNAFAAKAIAHQAGITNYKAGFLPQEKAEFVKRLQAEGKTVGMVGDGINDSNALAQADISIAMGKGSDIAMDVAKMTIISNDLRKIPQAIQISSQTIKAIRQNLFWAFIYNLIGIPIAAGILYPINGFLLNPMIAGLAMALSSVSVVTNSLRVRMKKVKV